MRKTLIFLSVLGLLAVTSPAWGYHDATWNVAGSGDWMLTANWDWTGDGGPPPPPPAPPAVGSCRAYIDNGGTALVGTVAVPSPMGAGGYNVFVGKSSPVGPTEYGHIVVDAVTGEYYNFKSERTFAVYEGSTVTLNAGRYYLGDLRVYDSTVTMNSGYAAASRTLGLYSGGVVNLVDGHWYAQSYGSSTVDGGQFLQTGGTSNFGSQSSGLVVRNGGLYKITGGTTHFTYGTYPQLWVDNGGTFQIEGTAPCGIGGPGTPIQAYTRSYYGDGTPAAIEGTLKMGIDATAQGVTPLKVLTGGDADGYTGTLLLGAGSTLDMYRIPGTTPPEAHTTYDVVLAEGILNDPIQGLALATGTWDENDPNFWNFTFESVYDDEDPYPFLWYAVRVEWLRVPGDADLSDVVDGADLTIMAVQWGAGDCWEKADFNNDDTVDGADLTIMATHWGGTAPEPATLALLGLGGLALIRRRRRS